MLTGRPSCCNASLGARVFDGDGIAAGSRHGPLAACCCVMGKLPAAKPRLKVGLHLTPIPERLGNDPRFA